MSKCFNNVTICARQTQHYLFDPDNANRSEGVGRLCWCRAPAGFEEATLHRPFLSEPLVVALTNNFCVDSGASVTGVPCKEEMSHANTKNNACDSGHRQRLSVSPLSLDSNPRSLDGRDMGGEQGLSRQSGLLINDPHWNARWPTAR